MAKVNQINNICENIQIGDLVKLKTKDDIYGIVYLWIRNDTDGLGVIDIETGETTNYTNKSDLEWAWEYSNDKITINN